MGAGRGPDELIGHLGLEIGPRVAGSPACAAAADAIAAAFARAGGAVRLERFRYLGWTPSPVVLEVDGTPLAAAPSTWALPTPAGGVAGTLRPLGVVPILKGLIETSAFALLDASGHELGRVYANPNGCGAATLPSGRGAHLTGSAVWVSSDDGQRLAAASHALIEIADGAGPLHDANVIAEVAGESDELVIACAHYDSAWRAPGIVDNATGVEWLRRLLAQVATGPRPRRTLRVIALAAEEIGLIGARRHAAALLASGAPPVRAVVNVDAMGGSPTLLLQATPGSALEQPMRAAAQALAVDGEVGAPGPGSDQMAFHELGIPVAGFLGAPDYAAYHQPAESLAALDCALFEQAQQAATDVVTALLDADATA
ncbi:MAG TPA: M20/M25/M40 family metallo-hydrolase [Conexibacter sp.]|jgi:hypothetical protein